MQSVLTSAMACVVGALETESTNGVLFHRTPRAARARMTDPFLNYHSSVASGVRIEALTDSSTLEIDVELQHMALPGLVSKGSTFDVVIAGELRDPVRTSNERLILLDPATRELRLQSANPTTLRFHLGDVVDERRVEVWFPASSAVQLLDVRISDGARLQPAPSAGPLWVHHGSSISQCSDADRPTGTWPAIAARKTGRSLLNLGIGGQCQLDQFMARTIRDLPATAISLELGINVVNADTMRERAFVAAFHGFLDTIRDGHPDTPVLVVTPIICPIAEHRPGPTLFGTDGMGYTPDRPSELSQGALTLIRVRELLRQHVEVRRQEGDTMLNALDGLTLFGTDDINDLPDGLHPNAAGYQRIAERFLPLAFGVSRPLG